MRLSFPHPIFVLRGGHVIISRKKIVIEFDTLAFSRLSLRKPEKIRYYSVLKFEHTESGGLNCEVIHFTTQKIEFVHYYTYMILTCCTRMCINQVRLPVLLVVI